MKRFGQGRTGAKGREAPVSGGERHAALLPDDVRFGVSSDPTLEDDTSSLHQLLSGRLVDEEGRSSLSCAHLRHHLFLRLNSNTEENQQAHHTLQP